jgi:putative ABC transport system permease protein
MRGTREIGVRMTLGAKPSQIVRLVLASCAGAVATGTVCGVAGAAALSALLVHSIPGVRPFDPLTYLNVVALLSSAVAVGSFVPARRAARVDPLRALRWE